MEFDRKPELPEGMTYLQYTLAMLDAALTDKPWRSVEHTSRNQHSTEESVSQCTYYLSDGGYSRVCLDWMTDDDHPIAFLDSISRQEVKDN